MIGQIKATHYMIFSISAFALFILMSYYASTTTLQTQLPHGHAIKSLHMHAALESNGTLNGANLGEFFCLFSCA